MTAVQDVKALIWQEATADDIFDNVNGFLENESMERIQIVSGEALCQVGHLALTVVQQKPTSGFIYSISIAAQFTMQLLSNSVSEYPKRYLRSVFKTIVDFDE